MIEKIVAIKNILPLKLVTAFILIYVLTFNSFAQDETINPEEEEVVEEVTSEDEPETVRHKDKRNVKNSFNSIWIMDQQTPLVPIKGTVEMDIQHRFGTVLNGWDDFFGIFASSNIRLGAAYVPVKGLMLGWGMTRERMQMDFNAKYALLEQKQGGSPLSITYYGNMSLETRKKKFYTHGSDRLSYFNQIIIGSKVCDALSILVAPSLSWFNNVEGYLDNEGNVLRKRNNYHFGISSYARVRINSKLALTLGYDQPLTKHRKDNPNPNISLGLEMSTSNHSFQVLVGNYQSIVPQANHFNNSYDYTDGAFLLGFNITRLWNR